MAPAARMSGLAVATGSVRRPPKAKKPGLVIFSDLDGTLLDFHTHSFAPAAAALRELKRLSIPLVLVSSKTRAEIQHIRRQLGIDGPFIPENGGAIVWPKSMTPEKPRGARDVDGVWVHELGTPYAAVRKRLVDFRQESGLKCEGFGDWSAEVVARFCGIPVSIAALARQREYDEPFLFNPKPADATLQNLLRRLGSDGFSITNGARFYHLAGPTDKGRAVSELIRWYERTDKVKPRTIALGDSPNDWSMMQACDIAIAVKCPDGRYHSGLRDHQGVRLAGAPGPEGFNRIVLRLLKQML